jgi:hypothetical protein
MKTFNFMQALIPYNLKGPRSKALEPDCLFPSTFNYDTVSLGRGWGEGFWSFGDWLLFGIWDLGFGIWDLVIGI